MLTELVIFPLVMIAEVCAISKTVHASVIRAIVLRNPRIRQVVITNGRTEVGAQRVSAAFVFRLTKLGEDHVY